MNTDLHGFFGDQRRSLVLIFILFFVFTFSGCNRQNQAAQQESEENSPVAQENAFDVEASDINLAKPLEISAKTEDVALAKKIDEIIDASNLSNARWGVFAVSLKDGRVLVARDGRKLFNPASIQKTLTSIVALDKLGADFRWRTHIYAKNQIESDGSLNGDLTLYGEGAPDFDTDGLNDLVNQLAAKGLKRVKGNIIGDESYFRGEDIGDGWTWNDLQWHYGAEASALTFRENQAGVYVNDSGELTSSTDFLQVKNGLQPKEAGKPDSFGIRRGLANNEVYVWGNGKKASGKMSVHNPALWAAKSLREALERKGIVIEGETQSADWQSEDKLDPTNAVELASVESATLAEIIQRMNKRSVNIYAELLLRTLGKKFGDDAPDQDRNTQETRGDDSAGASVIKKFLTQAQVATDELQIHDGSGLSRLDFITPEAFGRALIYAAQSNFAEVFENSLPIAGTDGTLGGRLGNAKGKILAKTGSITYVSSLAGYAQRENETLAFAIICNNVTGKKDGPRVVDQIAQALVSEHLQDKLGNQNSKSSDINSK